MVWVAPPSKLVTLTFASAVSDQVETISTHRFSGDFWDAEAIQ